MHRNHSVSQSLTPEQLGEAGESKFRLLCAQAKLICNKSSRDMTGWDFLVESPVDQERGLTLDQRECTSCLIQLKSTTNVDRGLVLLRLSAIERLAKDPRPAAVIVFHLHPDGEPIAGYLVHLIDAPLAHVLKRLRATEASGTRSVNHTTVTFNYRKVGTRFDLTPEGLGIAIATMCGDSPAAYVSEKQHQLTELGYERGRWQFNALVRIEDPHEFNDVLLGLKPIRPERLDIYDARFGILIGHAVPPSLLPDEIQLTPPRIGDCEVCFRGPPLAPAVVFACEAYIGPPMAEIGGPDILIRHPDFLVRCRPDGLRFETTHVEASPRPLDRWVLLLRALSHVASGQGNITIAGVGSLPTLTLSLDGAMDGPYVEDLPRLAHFVEGWQQLLNSAGVKSITELAMGELWKASSARAIVEMLLNPKPRTRLEIQQIDGMDSAASVEALLFGTCRLADAAISYCAKVQLAATHETRWKYRSTAFTLLDIRRAVEDDAVYGEEQCTRHGMAIALNHKDLLRNGRPVKPENL